MNKNCNYLLLSSNFIFQIFLSFTISRTTLSPFVWNFSGLPRAQTYIHWYFLGNSWKVCLWFKTLKSTAVKENCGVVCKECFQRNWSKQRKTSEKEPPYAWRMRGATSNTSLNSRLISLVNKTSHNILMIIVFRRTYISFFHCTRDES